MDDDLDTVRGSGVSSGADRPEVLPEVFGQRFRRISQIARGGSGTLFRAEDTTLKSPAALKVIRIVDRAAVKRELSETPIEGRFKHPYLVRLISRGTHGPFLWLAMEWVDGGTLLDVIDRLHPDQHGDCDTLETAASRSEMAESTPELAWATSILPALYLLSEAALGLGAAHQQGLVHLDLKPDNIMFELRAAGGRAVDPAGWRAWQEGDGGDTASTEVPVPRLIDWGVSESVEAARGNTVVGIVPGVPAYMAPERAAGRAGAIKPTADVYALGAILFHLLTGNMPYGQRSRADVLQLLLSRTQPEIAAADPDHHEFVEVCRRAMHPSPEARYADGTEFGLALRRAQALRGLRGADALRARADELRTRAHILRQQGSRLLRDATPNRMDTRYRAWGLEDRAIEYENEANLREAQWLQAVRAVFSVVPDLPEGRAVLIGWRCAQLRDAERTGDARTARLTLETLKTDLQPFAHRAPDALTDPVRDVLATARHLIEGTARLTLRTLPDAHIEVTRQIEVQRRLRMGPTFSTLGMGALDGCELDFGRIVLRFTAPGHHPVLYPLRLHRGEHWSAIAPGDAVPRVIPLPPLGTVAPDEAYVPPGWAWLGGQPFAADAIEPGRRVWIGGFVIKRNPVTHRDWLAYLDALIADGRSEEAIVRVPGTPGIARPPSVPKYVLDGRVYRIDDPDRAEEMLDWPVSSIGWDDASAYATWRSEVDGLPWRLPCEWEFEKATRCNDERRLPSGEHMEPSWTCIGRSTSAQYHPVGVQTETEDETVHGVRWTVGNVLSWCLDPWSDDGPEPGSRVDIEAVRRMAANPYRMLRGGAFVTPESLVSGSTRFAVNEDARATTAGVRLVRSWP